MMPNQGELRPRGVSGTVMSRMLRPIALLCMFATITGCTDFKRWLYEGFNREAWQHREEVIQALNIRPGDYVADLGSGSGYFTFLLAKTVAPRGKVYAIDIDADMNTYVAARAREEGYTNIEVILAKPDDPLLPETGVDLIFNCITYHHLEDRVSYFKNVSKYLRPGGRIAIIDFNEKAWWLAKLFGHWTASEVLHRELKEAGYAVDQEFSFLPKQMFLIFSRDQKKAEEPSVINP